MLNAITGEDRAIVSPVAGTTRDSFDTEYEFDGRPLVFVDTAGLRRRGKAGRGIEKFSVLRTVQAIERAHVAVLLLDASEGVTAQDAHVAGLIEDAGRAAVICQNKWDLADELELEQVAVKLDVRGHIKFLDGAPIQFTSALEARGVKSVLRSIFDVYAQWTRKVNPGDLQRVLLAALAEHPIPTGGKEDVKMTSVTQIRSEPPCFLFKVNKPDRVHFSYKRYLENRIRDEFGFNGTPLRLMFRTRV
jgi:GTP-binding protein